MDNIIKIGNDEQIINQIESTLSISQQDAESIFKYLQLSFQENTDVFGCIYTNAPEGMEMMAKGGQYYINMPKFLLVFIALLLDITLSKGVILSVCGMAGVSTQVLYPMNQRNGESCLFREYVRNKGFFGNNWRPSFPGKACVNIDLSCEHLSKEGTCTIQEADIELTLSRFKKIKVIR